MHPDHLQLPPQILRVGQGLAGEALPFHMGQVVLQPALGFPRQDRLPTPCTVERNPFAHRRVKPYGALCPQLCQIDGLHILLPDEVDGLQAQIVQIGHLSSGGLIEKVCLLELYGQQARLKSCPVALFYLILDDKPAVLHLLENPVGGAGRNPRGGGELGQRNLPLAVGQRHQELQGLHGAVGPHQFLQFFFVMHSDLPNILYIEKLIYI